MKKFALLFFIFFTIFNYSFSLLEIYNYYNPNAYYSSPWKLRLFLRNNDSNKIYYVINTNITNLSNVKLQASNLSISPNEIKEIDFYLEYVDCNLNDTFFNLTVKYTDLTNNYTISKKFPFNVSVPLSINTTIGDTYSIANNKIGDELFTIRNNSTRKFTFKIIPTDIDKVYLQFITPKGIFDQNEIKNVNFTISGEDSILFRLKLYPILVGDSYVNFDIVPYDYCDGNLSKGFNTIVMTQLITGAYTSLDENINFIFVLLLVLFLLVKFIN